MFTVLMAGFSSFLILRYLWDNEIGLQIFRDKAEFVPLTVKNQKFFFIIPELFTLIQDSSVKRA